MRLLLIFLTSLVLVCGMLPAFAEVVDMNLDKINYQRGENIHLRGVVSENSSGLVSIVFRDSNDEFVILSQSIIRGDSSFEKIVSLNEKFHDYGTYNVTAFVLNMTAAKTLSFNLTEELNQKNQSIKESEIENPPYQISPNVQGEPIEKSIPNTETDLNQENHVVSKIADFVDENKNPQYYLDRYYNEPTYKSWFDRNYSDLTIEEAVGYVENPKSQIKTTNEIIKADLIPKAEATSITTSTKNFENNSDVATTGLVIGGLAILFGAVYGIKRKVDDNTKHISINKDVIRKKFLSYIVDSNPLAIIQTRLAKGEITIEEYEKIKEKLVKT